MHERQQQTTFWDENLKNYGRMLTKQRPECVESVFTVRDRQFDECQSPIGAVHTNSAVICYACMGSGGDTARER